MAPPSGRVIYDSQPDEGESKRLIPSRPRLPGIAAADRLAERRQIAHGLALGMGRGAGVRRSIFRVVRHKPTESGAWMRAQRRSSARTARGIRRGLALVPSGDQAFRVREHLSVRRAPGGSLGVGFAFRSASNFRRLKPMAGSPPNRVACQRPLRSG
jgi:hypothetical protein